MFLIIIIAISLSMDAFSLALAYGMYNFSKKEIINLSIIVGIYHFIMPLIGNNFGIIIFKYIKIKPTLIVAAVFIIIGSEMIVDMFKKEEKTKLNGIIEMLGFGFAVSIDAFSTGIGIKMITSKVYLSYFTFSFVSFSFTLLGLLLGKKISDKVGDFSSFIGATILIIIGISYIFR